MNWLIYGGSLLVIILILIFIRDRSSQRTLVPFIVYWYISLLFVQFGVYDLDTISNSTLLIIVIGLICFVFGYAIIKSENVLFPTFNKVAFDAKIDLLLYSKIFNVVMWLVLFYMLSIFAVYLKATAALSVVGDVRNLYYEENLYGDRFALLNDIVIQPFLLLIRPVFAYTIIFHRNWRCIPMLAIMLISSTITGGRFGYLYIAIPLLLTGYCLRDRLGGSKKLNKKERRILFIGIALLFSFVLFQSANRYTSSNDSNFAKVAWEMGTKDIVKYSVGPMVAFDYALDNRYLERLGGYQYGGLTFSGFEAFLHFILHRIGGMDHELSLTKLSSIIQFEQIQIGINVFWNALYTWFLYFYLDFGMAGVILLSMFFGMLMRLTVKLFLRKYTIKTFMLVGVFFQLSMMSPITFSIKTSMLTLIIVLLFAVSNRDDVLLTKIK